MKIMRNIYKINQSVEEEKFIMQKNLEKFISSFLFIAEKYLYPKKKWKYLVKGCLGAIIFSITSFFLMFGSIEKYQKQIHDAKELQIQSQIFTHSSFYLVIWATFLLFTFTVGYIYLTLLQILIDFFRGKLLK